MTSGLLASLCLKYENRCQFKDLNHRDKSQMVQFTAAENAYSCGRRYVGIEHNTNLLKTKNRKEAAVKIAINEELSKAVIKPIKLYGISGQRICYFPIWVMFVRAKANTTAEFTPCALNHVFC